MEQSSSKSPMRKLLPIVLCILLAGMGGIWYFFFHEKQPYVENSSFKAIPVHSPLLLEIPSLEEFMDQAAQDNELVQKLRNMQLLAGFWAKIDSIDLSTQEYEKIADIIGNRSITIAFNHQGKDGVVPLYTLSLSNHAEEKVLGNTIEDLAKERALSLKEFNYENQKVYQLDWKPFGAHYFAISQGIFMMSPSRILVEEAMRQITTNNLMDDQAFTNLYGTVSHSSLFNLYVNHGEVSVLLQKMISPKYRTVINDVKNFAKWSEYDVTSKGNQLWLNGYSSIGQKNDSYLTVLRRQEPQRFDMDEAIPSKCSMFLNFNLEDYKTFQIDYSKYLEPQSKAYYERETRIMAIEKQTRQNLISLFADISDNDFALVYGNAIQNAPEKNRFFIAKAKSRSIAKSSLVSMLEQYAKREGISAEQLKSTYSLDSDEQYDIYKFPFADCAELLFGQAFSGVACNYLSFYDNYIIFGDELESVQNYIHDLVLSSTLEEDSYFQHFDRKLDSKSNIYFYLNLSRIFFSSPYYLTEDASAVTQENESFIRKLSGFGWQISQHEQKYVNNMYLLFDPDMEDEPQAIWESVLDSTVFGSPQIVINHRNRKSKEVIVQDKAHNLYLINKEGVQLWKIPLSGDIMGEIQQIDIYNNGRLQYLFNTKNKLYIIDRNGNNVGKFPITLRSPATNGVAVFDYSNNSHYRFFLAGEDNKTYVYDKNANVITGWRAKKTDSRVSSPILHEVINGKDYIIYADEHNTYIQDRQGTDRLDMGTSDKFLHSANKIFCITHNGKKAIAATDTKGEIHLQFLDGSSKVLKFTDFGEQHFFVAHDLDKDGEEDFIFARENVLVAFTSDGDELFENKFKSDISQQPEVFNLGEDELCIGVICGADSQIHLIDTEGEEQNGFPLKGNTNFCIDKLSAESPSYNLLIGYSNKSLLNYTLE